jgi:hypothetical protein
MAYSTSIMNTTSRTKTQIACDGVRTVWVAEQQVAPMLGAVKPGHLSIDGVVVRGTVQDVAAHVHKRDIVRVFERPDLKAEAKSIARFIGVSMDGVRPPLRPVIAQ